MTDLGPYAAYIHMRDTSMTDVFDDIDALVSEANDDVTRTTLQRIADHMRLTDAANVSYLNQLLKAYRRIEQLESAAAR